MLVFPVPLFVSTFAAKNKDYEENDRNQGTLICS